MVGKPALGRAWTPLSTQTPSSPPQGPIHVGTGCFVSGLDVAQSQALHGVEDRRPPRRGLQGVKGKKTEPSHWQQLSFGSANRKLEDVQKLQIWGYQG